MRIWLSLACALALAGCTVLRPREDFSEAALFTQDADYIAHRYKPEDMPRELRAELTAAGYECGPAADGGTQCQRAEPARPGCDMVWSVRILPTTAQAVRRERCAAIVSPP